jgi:CheY-like chemotaxis protein
MEEGQVTEDRSHQCSILVVEDEPELREVLQIALEADGYDVATAVNGRDALKHLRTTADTCLIILDLHVPVMNGREFRAAQLRDRSLAWIPVIVISGGLEGARDARELGARAFMRKPVDVDALREAVRQVECRRAQLGREQRQTHC